MLDAQGVVDLLLEVGVRVNFVQHENDLVKTEVCRGTATGDYVSCLTLGLTRRTLRTLAVSVRALLHFNLESLCLSCPRGREVNLQYSVAKLRRHLRAISIFRQGKAASEATKGTLDTVKFSLLILLLGFAFSGNAKDAVFDCYPHVILLHFRQVCLEEVLVLILTDINARRPICDCQAVRLRIIYSVRKSGEETIEAILGRFLHLSHLIPCY
jgi:hypothetical protein